MEKKTNAYNKVSALEGRTLVSVIDNCSTYAIDYGSFGHLGNSFLPPNMTSCMQPVDAVILRSSRFAFR